MEAITVYKSKDGRRYDKVDDCLTRDKLFDICEEINKQLAPLPDGTDFANGEGFIQYDIHYINNIKLQLLKAVENNTEWDALKKAVNEQRLHLHHFGILGRYLDDSDSIFYQLYCRLFGNIDELGREWGQSYYKLHPGNAIQTLLFNFPF